ncbi:glutaminyl-peptide cyclotransferase [Flavobacterium sp.]|uniref:glutaminyl-peptide cyclotransferase n=1 Tax=Flavobacterium sp. TaxID=239 RepID=UPI00286E4550|nr:glutaminyl-peptide cyclotransferase [Flavobacterium sp.]
MKKYNLLAFITLMSFFSNCSEDKKNLFSIDESQFKLLYHTDDVVSLSIKNEKNKKIDSVVYFNNDKKLTTIKENTVFKFDLANEKLGYKNIKVLVYYEGESAEIQARIEVVSSVEPRLLNYTIINTYPHDLKAYTQGLEFYRDTLYEGTGNGAGSGTGIRGISSLRKTNYKTGEVYKKIELSEKYFGEGITVLNNKVYQLTYQNNEGYVYNADTFAKEKTLPYFKKMEGWGLTNDGKNLYMTDSTETIQVLDPETFKSIDNFTIYSGSTKIPAVNELEWVDGKMYGNIYQKDALAIINPKTGAVEAVVNLVDLKSKVKQHPDVDVLNGVAYNPKTKTFFVTGKNWDKMFEIKIKD